MTDREKLLRIVSDPVLWIETFVSIADKKGKIVPFKLNPQQKYILRNKGKFNICLKSRQLGITSVALAYSLYIALTKPNSTCMIMSYSDKGVNEIFEKLRIMNEHLPRCVAIPMEKDNKTEIKFANASRIINCTCGTKDQARGSTIYYAHLSEVAFMGENFDKQLLAIEQAIVPDGSMILESTANGLNHFSELWNKVVSGEAPLWKPFFFSWVQDKKMFAEEYREYAARYRSIYGDSLHLADLDDTEQMLHDRGATLSQLMWRRLKISNSSEDKFCQEFPSNPTEAFLSTGANIFSPSILQERLINLPNTPIMRLPDDGIDPIIRRYARNLTIWRLPAKGKRYFLGVDTGEGLGKDYSVVEVIDEDGFQCAEWRSNRVKPYEFAEVVYKLAQWYGNGMLVIERASGGHTVIDKVHHDYRYINLYKQRTYDQRGIRKKEVGWKTTETTKPMMISVMQEMFETGRVLVNSKTLLQEMKLFEQVGNKMQAVNGHDDTVMAFAMACMAMKEGKYYMPW